jgi:hypothetical protein
MKLEEWWPNRICTCLAFRPALNNRVDLALRRAEH